MLKVLKKRYLPYGCTWDSIILFLQANLFNGNCLSGFQVNCFVNDTVGSLSKLLQLFVLVKALDWLDHLLINSPAHLATPLIL